MIRHEEVVLLEQAIRHRPAGKNQNIDSLKAVLRDGLTDFEEMLKPLSDQHRQAALSLFLEKMRETALQFHLAVLKLFFKNELMDSPTPAKARELMSRCEEDMKRIARLYKLL
jgi:hypothetical protein